jgi:uncharacterized membrane protein
MKTTASLLSLVLPLSLTLAGCGPSLAALQERASAGQVQADAPLHARQAITIHAPRERVWAVLTDFDRWPSWQPNIARVQGPRALAAGEPFTWVNGKSEISSTLALVKPNEALAWTGSVSGAKAIHVFSFRAEGPDATVVEVEETLDGFLLTWFYGQKDLDAEVARSLANLKKASEVTPGT